MAKKEFTKIISPSGDDCSHGFLHRDVMFPDGKKEKHPLNIPGLKTALLYAEQDIRDRWKWYRDRYRRRLRK